MQVSQHREKDTLSRLAQFTSKLRAEPAAALDPPAEAAEPAAAPDDADGAKPSSRVDIQEVSPSQQRAVPCKGFALPCKCQL